jgi:IS1 family transposase
MNKLTRAKRAQILALMVEGVSIRSITRLTGASKNTVAKLLVEAGTACREYQDATLRNLPCKRVQCDEIWSFVYAKQKNVPESMRDTPGVGSVWTWTAICADTKLIASFHVGTRDAGCAYEFMTDLASRLQGRVQLTTDGHSAYLNAVRDAFGRDIDYAMLIKLYGESVDKEGRYSPPTCIGTRTDEIIGYPKAEHISTSYVERQNLSMRMGMRRFTRLTNAFSKKIENHQHAIAIYFMHYNFVRIHKTLRCTPAMEAKVTDRLWSMDDMLAVVEAWEARQQKKTGTDSN